MKLPVHRTFWTSASTADVFAFLADFRNAETWDPGTDECTLITGPVGDGATYRNVSTFLGRSTELTYTTLAHQPETHLHFQGRNDSFIGDDRLTLTPSGAGTTVDYRAEFELKGLSQLGIPLVAAYLPFLATKTIRQMKETLDRL